MRLLKQLLVLLGAVLVDAMRFDRSEVAKDGSKYNHDGRTD